ncbi:MAG: 50S ribosome-binding GTPase [Hormoscilla sp. GUM202]|nr:50S ribosome-binding GTPase [Hormoscilla sp. GUM202]
MDVKIEKKFDEVFSEFERGTHGLLQIAVFGRVSSGKSSFLNAFLDRAVHEKKFDVAARAGVTTEIVYHYFGEHIQIIDTPGLVDVVEENSKVTEKVLKGGVDVGILLLHGVTDLSQKEIYEQVKSGAQSVFLVRNFIDQESKKIREQLDNQWRQHLNLRKDQRIYGVSCRGYDPEDRIIDPISGEEHEIPLNEYGVPKTIKGVNELQNDVIAEMFKIGKSVFLARELNGKRKQALAIISTACVTCVAAQFIPGTIAIIGATIAGAISSLKYLYTGSFASKSEAKNIMGIFVTEGIGGLGVVAYEFFVSFLPPNGILDTAGIILTIPYYAAMLIVVQNYLEQGLEISKSESTDEKIKSIYKDLRVQVANMDVRKIGDRGTWGSLLSSFLVRSPIA